MQSVLGLLTFGLFLGALSDRYCKHPTLSAVETKKAGRRLFTLPALEIVWRARMEYCVDCISDNLYFILYIVVSVNKLSLYNIINVLRSAQGQKGLMICFSCTVGLRET